MSMRDENVTCWSCHKPWHECLGACYETREHYVAQSTQFVDETADRIRALTHEIADTYLKARQLEDERSRLQRLKNGVQSMVSSLCDTIKPQFIKVAQEAPCWRCKRRTQWRNYHGAPEHKECPDMPGGVSFAQHSLIGHIRGNTIDVDALLREQEQAFRIQQKVRELENDG